MELEDEQKNFVMEFKKLPEDERLAYAVLHLGEKIEKQNSVMRYEIKQLKTLMLLIIVVLFPLLVTILILLALIAFM